LIAAAVGYSIPALEKKTSFISLKSLRFPPAVRQAIGRVLPKVVTGRKVMPMME